MDACTSKPWESDLRDIRQGSCCFFACCKGQIIIRTSEVDSAEIEDIEENVKKEIYDPRLVWSYSLLLCGPTGCRKTTWIVELLKHHEELCTHIPKKLI